MSLLWRINLRKNKFNQVDPTSKEVEFEQITTKLQEFLEIVNLQFDHPKDKES